MKKKVAVLVGSLRKESFHRRIALELIRLSPDGLNMQLVEIGELNLYNEDLEEHAPKAWTDYRKKIGESDAILFVSPEYNRSIPGVLKNAIDIATRPPTENVLLRKPAAVVTGSSSGIGGFGSNHAIRQSVVFSQVRMLPNEVYIGQMDKRFKEDEKTLVDDTQKYLKKFLKDFEEWITLFS